MAEQTELPRDLIDEHLDKVLRASGSALKHYTMALTLERMRNAMADARNKQTP